MSTFWDAEVEATIHAEVRRQQDELELIASENYTSEAVLRAVGSPLTNKYAEGLTKSTILRWMSSCRCGGKYRSKASSKTFHG